ncbi:MAG: hypothetical protein LBQ57_11270 [Spirochaetales bacterium]|jgi:hypothetical protein|nr:hypothetical protein [Spirochaetales bacterium]
MEKLEHRFAAESTKLTNGGNTYRTASFKIIEDKIEIFDHIWDGFAGGGEYEREKTITIESEYFEKINECINKLYADDSSLNNNSEKECLNENERVRKYLFKNICLAYEHGGFENILNILKSNNILYNDNTYSVTR